MPYNAIVVISDPLGEVVGWTDAETFARHEENMNSAYIVERFTVRIPEEAIAEWLHDREKLRGLGFPDRPPDVDTPRQRAWVRHPGEDASVGRTLDPYETRSWFTVMTMTRAIGAVGFQMMVIGKDDGTYHWSYTVTLDSTVIQDGSWASKPETPDEVVWETIEGVIQFVCEAPPDDADDEDTGPQVTYYDEQQQMDAEIELACADVRRGFVSPLPEGRA